MEWIMSIAQNYRVPIFEGEQRGSAIFFRSDKGDYDLRFGWGCYTASLHRSLAEAIEDFRAHLQSEHDGANDGIVVSIGTPVEIDENEASR
jgi:hypothetical protein